MVNTLAQRCSGWQLPSELAENLSLVETIRQGTKEVSDQFSFASAHDSQISFYVASLGPDIAMLMFVSANRDVFSTIAGVGEHIHRPGDFLSYPVEMPLRSRALRMPLPWQDESSFVRVRR